jgi:polysaccharide pyruvyl transferase WcaK-like protein
MEGGYTRDNMFGLRISYQDLVYSLIDFFIRRKSARVLLVPHVLGANNDLESDSRACETVFEAMKNQYQGQIGLTRGTYDYNEIKYVIGRCDFFVGARMHACIGALSQHVPTVSIAYSDKFVGVMESVGLGDVVADPRSMTQPEILDIVDRVFERRDAVRRELEIRMPLVKHKIDDAVAQLGSVLAQV